MSYRPRPIRGLANRPAAHRTIVDEGSLVKVLSILLIVLFVLNFIAAFYVLSVLFWSWLLMLGVSWSGAEHWSYLYTCTHWGALVPFVLGIFSTNKISTAINDKRR
jgi:hypothetical protein